MRSSELFSRLDESPPQTPRLYYPHEHTGAAPPVAARRESCLTRLGFFVAGGGTVLAVCAIAVAGIMLGVGGGADDGGRVGPSTIGTVNGLRFSSTGPSSLSVIWDRPSSSPSKVICSSYQLEVAVAPNGGGSILFPNATHIIQGMDYSATVKRLNASTSYCFRIRARSDLGDVGTWSAQVCNSTTAPEVPGPPPMPVVVDVSSSILEDKTAATAADVLHVKIPLPQENGGQSITMIRVSVHGMPVASKNITDISESGGDAHISFDFNTRGSLLAVSSKACNDVGCGILSPATNCIIAERSHPSAQALCSACPVGIAGGSHSPGSTLPAPNDLIASPSPGSTSLSLSWTWKSTSCNVADDRPGVFNIQRSDWWQKIAIVDGPETNVSVPPASTGANIPQETLVTRLLPSATYSMRVRALSSHDRADRASGWVYVSVVMPDSGACGNLADLSIQREEFGSLVPKIQSCMLSCILSGDPKCVSSCVQRKLAFSSACATCWAAEAKCTLAHCSVPCLKDPKGSPCLDCTDRNCMPALEICTGLPRYTFPNPSHNI